VKALQIFKPGKHKAFDGRVISFGEAELRAAAAVYDPALHEAPLVIGHPESNAPAYGRVKSLSYSERVLTARARPGGRAIRRARERGPLQENFRVLLHA